MKNKYTIILIRLGLSILFLCSIFIIVKPDFVSIIRLFSKIKISLYAAAFMLLLIQQFLAALSWHIALVSKGHKFSHSVIYKSVLIGNFFGLMLPSGIGADLILVFNIGKSLSNKQDAVSSLLFIRYLWLVSLILISLIGTFALPSIKHLPFIKIFLSIALLLSFLVYPILFILDHKKLKKFNHIMQKYSSSRLIYNCYISLNEFGKNARIVILIFFLSIVNIILKISVDYMLSLCLGINLPFVYFIAFVPLVVLSSLIPISFGGLGIREWVYIYLLGTLGVQASYSFSISIASFTITLLVSLIGGVLYIIRGAKIKYNN